MTASAIGDRQDRRARWVVAALTAAKLIIHLGVLDRYGWHRDELYFVDCGRHLAWGYVDHAPLVPWISRLVTEVFGTSLVALRIVAAVASAAGVVLAARLAREMGGGTYAQGMAALGVLAAPAYWRMGAMFNIVVFEPLFWSAGALLVARILRGGSPRLWLGVGIVVGMGLLNKHTMVLWGAGLSVGLALTGARRHLKSRWPWLGALLALLVFSPNLWWQYAHGWPTLEFITNMSRSLRARVPPALFLGAQALYFQPLAVVLWGAGLVRLLGRRGEPYRPLGIQFAAIVVILLVTGGKPYYLAPAYPVLFAAGGVALEGGLRRRMRRAYAAVLAVVGTAFAALSLPLFPLPTIDRALGALFGRIVPPIALTHDLHDEYGWREQVEVVAAVHRALERQARGAAMIVAGNYGEASAVNVLGRDLGLPRALSGHMTHHLWGRMPKGDRPLILYGLPPDQRSLLCRDPVEAATHRHPLGREEENVTIYVCRRRRATPSEAWSALRWYGHSHGRRKN